MSIAEIRRDNLIKEIKKVGSQQKLAEKVGITQGQVSQLVTGRGQLGETLSRKIERKLGLNEYCLDGPEVAARQVNIDTELLEEILLGVELWHVKTGKELTPQKKAKAVTLFYKNKEALSQNLFDDVLSML